MNRRYESNIDCPRAGCGSSDVEIVAEPLYQFGDEEPAAIAPKGAACRVCGLRFVNEDVRERIQNDDRFN